MKTNGKAGSGMGPRFDGKGSGFRKLTDGSRKHGQSTYKALTLACDVCGAQFAKPCVDARLIAAAPEMLQARPVSAHQGTPAPWVAQPRNGASLHVTGPRKMPNGKPYTSVPGIVVAYVADTPDPKIAEADQRLIAAAPEMLEFVRLVEARHWTQDDALDVLVDEARAILARVDEPA